jgi:hypothetical protein
MSEVGGVDGLPWPNYKVRDAKWELESSVKIISSGGRRRTPIDLSSCPFQSDEVPGIGIAFFEKIDWVTDHSVELRPLITGVQVAPERSAVKIVYQTAGEEMGDDLEWGGVIQGWECSICDLGDLGGEEELAAHYAITHHEVTWVEVVSKDEVSVRKTAGLVLALRLFRSLELFNSFLGYTIGMMSHTRRTR